MLSTAFAHSSIASARTAASRARMPFAITRGFPCRLPASLNTVSANSSGVGIGSGTGTLTTSRRNASLRDPVFLFSDLPIVVEDFQPKWRFAVPASERNDDLLAPHIHLVTAKPRSPTSILVASEGLIFPQQLYERRATLLQESDTLLVTRDVRALPGIGWPFPVSYTHLTLPTSDLV